MANPNPPENALIFLKADLGFFNTSLTPEFESYLSGLILTATARIQRRKIPLEPGNPDSDQFVAAYAAWLYRDKTGKAMPESLAAEIRNRQVDAVTSCDPERS